jgi:hypothetical protein
VAAAASMQAREMVREIAAPTTPDGAAEARQTFFQLIAEKRFDLMSERGRVPPSRTVTVTMVMRVWMMHLSAKVKGKKRDKMARGLRQSAGWRSEGSAHVTYAAAAL